MAASLLKLRFDALDASAATLRTLLNRSRANPLTPELHELDNQIKEKFDTIKHTLKAFALLNGSPKADAAKMLLPVFKPYWNVMSQSLTNQATQLKELRERIAGMGDYLVALTTLELMDTWMEMGALDDQFNAIFDHRLETDTLATPAASSIKQTVVADYETFCSMLELTLATEPTAQLELLFGEVNELRKRYAPHHRHKLDPAHTTAEPIPTQSYFGGKPITPLTRVFYKTDAETIELKFTVDYEVSYKNNTEVGEAYMTIHGKGHYSGQYVTTFHIARTSPPALSEGEGAREAG
jgi:hypothetical protein